MPDSTTALINMLANPPNPFVTAGQAIQGMNALQDYRANAAAAEAYRQAVDPVTGQVDPAAFNAIASQLPGGSWKFGTQMQQIGQGMEAQGRGTAADLSAKQAKLSGIAGQIYPLMQRVLEAKPGDPPVTGAEVSAMVDQAEAMGLTTPDMLRNVRKQIGQIGPDGNANDLVRGMMYGTLTGEERLRALTGQPTAINQGPNTTFVQPVPGAAQPTTPSVPMGISPAERNTITQWLDAPGYSWTDNAGNPHSNSTRREQLIYQGINPNTLFTEPAPPLPPSYGSPAGGGGRGPTSGPAVSSVTTGRPAAAQGSTPAPPGGPRPVVTPPGATPSVTPPSALSPEQVKAGRETYAAEQQLHSTLGTRIGPLTQALSTLRSHPGMQTVGQDELYAVTQLGNAFGLNLGNVNNANAYQELSKNLEQYMQGLPGANRSDLASNRAAASTPHIGQGRGAMIDLLAKAVGLERFRTIGIDYFNQLHGNNPAEAAKNDAQYAIKTRDWLAKLDPQALSVDQMTPQQLQNYVKGLSPTDLERFKWSRKEIQKLHPENRLMP